MTPPRRPAAYLRTSAEGYLHAVTSAARQRGWSAPVIYADDDPAHHSGTALDRLFAAVTAARHDAVLMIAPADPVPLMRLLQRCTGRGVIVSFIAPPLPERAAVPPPRAVGATRGEPWDILARARLEALAGLFPDWRIWLDRHGWHARRRDTYLQGYVQGAPAFHVSAESATELAGQLCWQQAAEMHAPDGCRSAQAAAGLQRGARPSSSA